MKIDLYQFKVECYFNPPPDCPGEWRGLEIHIEEILANSAEVAKRAIKTHVLKRVGSQKHRLSYLNISEPVLVTDR